MGKNEKEMLSQSERFMLSGMYNRIIAAEVRKYGHEISDKQLMEEMKKKRGTAVQANLITSIKVSSENNDFYNMKIGTLFVLADTLDISLDYLVFGSEDERHLADPVGMINNWRRKADKYDAISKMIKNLDKEMDKS